MTDDNTQLNEPEALFLYIPVSRLIILSILSCGTYEAYWIYKNWRYLKDRDNLKIHPFWRGIFGLFFCHSLLKTIHGDTKCREIQEPEFSPGGLATGWVILMILANLISRAPGAIASIIGFIMPSYLCFVPVQRYINSINKQQNPNAPYYGWSAGHVVCLLFGLAIWVLTLLVIGYE